MKVNKLWAETSTGDEAITYNTPSNTGEHYFVV